MSNQSSARHYANQLAQLTARASYATTHEAIAMIRGEADIVMRNLLEAARIEGRGFGEISDALQREPWVAGVLNALCEAQVREPLTECHHIPVLLRNAAKVICDAVQEDAGRVREPIIADQFKIGRRLATNFAIKFLAGDITQLDAGGIDATSAQRIAVLSCMAFNQEPEIASMNPFVELVAELDAAGVPDADRVSEDGIRHPLAGE
jgi:hypothetical protein